MTKNKAKATRAEAKRLERLTKKIRREERHREIEEILRAVRANLAIHSYAILGSVIVLVDFSVPGTLSVQLYRHCTAGMGGESSRANTKALLAEKKLWALPVVDKHGYYQLRHQPVKGDMHYHHTTPCWIELTCKGPRLEYL